MVLELLLGSLLSSVAGLTLALLTAVLTDHREQRRWLQTKVHQPMYGELTNVISGETPWAADEYTSRWADLDYYKVYRVDVELAEELDRYASELSELGRCVHGEDFEAFVQALPEGLCADGDGVAALPAGRTLDLRTWLRRNALVLATHPKLRGGPVGVEPDALDYLWAEVDGVAPEDGRLDTARALEAVSTEFNWGYEGFYSHWEEGWVDALADALAEANERPESSLPALLSRRRDLGVVASGARALIEERAERGLFGSLWHEWRSH